MGFSFTLCADDYGMTSGVSRGILELAKAGRISAASAMTNMPDWPRAAREWNEAEPPASLGLHLNLTAGRPLGAMPAFAPDTFPALSKLLKKSVLPPDELRSEIKRQIEAFIRHAGCSPAHLDGHQHVHVLGGIRPILFQCLKECGCDGLALRDSGDALWRILARGGPIGKAMAVAALSRGFAEQARRAGFPCNRGFAGFSAFDPRADMGKQFSAFLRAPGPDHLVMCHPGHVDDELRALDPVTQARETEWRFLLSEDFAAVLARAGARLSRPV